MAIEAIFNLPFAEQIDYFRRKLHLPTEAWDDLMASAHDRAFVVAGAMKADLLADIHASILMNMNGGGGLEGYRKDFKSIVAKHGWTGWTGEDSPAGVAWRTRTTYMTNLRTSVAAGRYKQLTNSPNLRYWMWRHSKLAREPRAQHLAWDGMVLPADHPFWKQHYPPQIPPHWGCRCRVVGVETLEDAKALGGDLSKTPPDDWQQVDAGYKDPELLAQGWNFAPGAHGDTALRELVEAKLIKLPAPIGAQMWEALSPVIAMEQRLAWTTLVSNVADGASAGNHAALAHVMSPATVDDLALRGQAPQSADIWLRDAELAHALRDAKTTLGSALDVATWRELPSLLQAATPYLDTLDTGLVYAFATADGFAKVFIRVNYASKVRIGKKRDRMTSNFIRTGGLVEPENMGKDARYVELKK